MDGCRGSRKISGNLRGVKDYRAGTKEEAEESKMERENKEKEGQQEMRA